MGFVKLGAPRDHISDCMNFGNIKITVYCIAAGSVCTLSSCWCLGFGFRVSGLTRERNREFKAP